MLLSLISHPCTFHFLSSYQHGFTAHGGRVLSVQAQKQILCPHTLLQDYFIPAHKSYTHTVMQA